MECQYREVVGKCYRGVSLGGWLLLERWYSYILMYVCMHAWRLYVCLWVVVRYTAVSLGGWLLLERWCVCVCVCVCMWCVCVCFCMHLFMCMRACVYMWVCMPVCMLYVCRSVYIYTVEMYKGGWYGVCMYTCMYACMYACMFVCVHVYMYVCVGMCMLRVWYRQLSHVRTYIHACIHTHACMHRGKYACIHVWMYAFYGPTISPRHVAWKNACFCMYVFLCMHASMHVHMADRSLM